jgi:hypothetical protein
MPVRTLQHAGSSHITGASYDDETQELSVSFKNGTYLYSNVPDEVALDFESAPSAGKYFDTNIKGNSAYPYRKA